MSWKPKVYVDHDPGGTTVYVEKPSGRYVAVYVGSAYDDDGVLINDGLRNQWHDSEKVFG
ncbi:hypothetical protein P5V64_21370 [Mycobacteroides abscessus subsp. abscessus]|uniref:hypothetical protein n=1 Tax=Mycobacteroides abscessus TaxID=36809 RepID=UPI00105738FC|nr:hypothetical protein [Mycobacteroides abscessus]MDO3076096.1 hypothetical protein [Mycobacteroides abscessus subsp. abscessus]MDO3120219.1 hypothetical protein [Mycobacteroides abscessus subsp. abscessus]MDO3242629.1 hypothetical protein [Mycobacteroides abscessus subsp. abscessus]MDO3324848.1 hypothetical protein [Mycobacteroides abscessus subsp. abscessus]WKE41500.1 hypothetical protein P3M62_11730 [Mycobacteroides abscessus subsp. abscessus]